MGVPALCQQGQILKHVAGVLEDTGSSSNNKVIEDIITAFSLSSALALLLKKPPSLDFFAQICKFCLFLHLLSHVLYPGQAPGLLRALQLIS